MCGIIGFFNHEKAESLVVRGLELIKNRGLDGAGLANANIVVLKNNVDELKKEKLTDTSDCIGHNLHSVVSIIPQPLINKKNDSRFAINCEIYNWEELNKRYGLKAKNDSQVVFKLIELNGIDKIKETLDLLDGVYAFVYWKDDTVIIARDIIGEKPIWYSLDEKLCFASEKKVLMSLGIMNIDELNPRMIIKYDIQTKKTELIKRDFFEIDPQTQESHKIVLEKTEKLIKQAIQKRVPQRKFGVLFSGGIDSTFIAYSLKKMGYEFTCYTAGLDSETEAEDITHAKKIAKELGFELKYKLVKLDDVPKYLKKIVPLIEDTNVTKVGVGLTFYVACELAKKDGVKVIFSGLGSEEIFAGYDRHKKSSDINKECLSGLRKMYERDLYRDDVITMNNNIELRLPFLDTKLVDYALKIAVKYKLNEKQNKIILREIAKKQGLSAEISDRPKRAAQYGSRFDNALIRLTRKARQKYRSEYLKQFYPYENLKIAALVSGGKDSFYAMHLLKRQNYEITCLVTIESENPDSYMYHTPNVSLTKLQAEACELPLLIQKTKGEKEDELKELELVLDKAKKEYGVEGVCSGAIFSNYQRDRIEKICDKLGLKIFSPLWHMNQELELRNLLEEGFEFMITKIAAYGLDKSWLGRKITHKDIEKLIHLHEKYKINIAFEGGEAETLIVDGPMFKKRLVIKSGEMIMENAFTGVYVIKEAELE